MNASDFTIDQIMSLLSQCYEKALIGLPTSKTAKHMADEYVTRYINPDLAVKKLVDSQVLKCTTSGFLTSLGGIITLPIAIPANIASVIYVQLRMIAAIASIGGYDPSEDEVQTLAYACLAGMGAGDICKIAGVNAVNKIATKFVMQKITGEFCKKVNQKIGFRFITKAGEKGIINLTKVVPLVGGFVGGGIDYLGTKAIAQKAYNTFIKNVII